MTLRVFTDCEALLRYIPFVDQCEAMGTKSFNDDPMLDIKIMKHDESRKVNAT